MFYIVKYVVVGRAVIKTHGNILHVPSLFLRNTGAHVKYVVERWWRKHGWRKKCYVPSLCLRQTEAQRRTDAQRDL